MAGDGEPKQSSPANFPSARPFSDVRARLVCFAASCLALVLSAACNAVEGDYVGPFGETTPFDAGDTGVGFGSAPFDSGGAPTPVCPFPPPANEAGCEDIDRGRDTVVTCVYDPCGGSEADPTPGSASAFVAVCFRGTWTRIPAGAEFVCAPFEPDAGSNDADAADRED